LHWCFKNYNIGIIIMLLIIIIINNDTTFICNNTSIFFSSNNNAVISVRTIEIIVTVVLASSTNGIRTIKIVIPIMSGINIME